MYANHDSLMFSIRYYIRQLEQVIIPDYPALALRIIMRAFILAITVMNCHAFYLSHTFKFPAIPYSAGVYHIHCPDHFMEAHGFALPGFRIIETRAPKSMGGYITTEFFYETYFNSRMSAKLFSSSLNTSHILLMDPDGIPCLLGRLSLDKCPPNGHTIRAHADLLRPASLWERMLGGKRLVKQCEVARAINVGYSNFKGHLHMKEYVNLVMGYSKSTDNK
jgi:hypothetical protein